MYAPLPPAFLHAARQLATRLPPGLRNRVFCHACNHLLHAQSLREALPELDGTRIVLALRDDDCAIGFEVAGTALKPSASSAFDVRITGSVEDFVALALRNEDPDTLFFQRRLCLEGDTARGLLLKNLLYAFDFDTRAHLESLLGPRIGRSVDALALHAQARVQALRARRAAAEPAHDETGVTRSIPGRPYQ